MIIDVLKVSLNINLYLLCASAMAPRYEVAVGLNRGHKTTKLRVAKTKTKADRADKTLKIRPARLKGVSQLCFNTFF